MSEDVNPSISGSKKPSHLQFREDLKFYHGKEDYIGFKSVAEYLILNSLKTWRDSNESEDEQDTVFLQIASYINLGVATESLLKAIYLKNNIRINKTLGDTELGTEVDDISSLQEKWMKETHSLGTLIDELFDKVDEFDLDDPEEKRLTEGLLLLKEMRDNLVHNPVSITKRREFGALIGETIKEIYKKGFDEEEYNQDLIDELDDFLEDR